jgi:hypothetical protein
MQTWIIQLSSGTVVKSDNVNVAHLTHVAQTVQSSAWADLDPVTNAAALLAWVAVLEANEQKIDLQDSIMNVMRLTVTELQSRIRVE